MISQSNHVDPMSSRFVSQPRDVIKTMSSLLHEIYQEPQQRRDKGIYLSLSRSIYSLIGMVTPQLLMEAPELKNFPPPSSVLPKEAMKDGVALGVLIMEFLVSEAQKKRCSQGFAYLASVRESLIVADLLTFREHFNLSSIIVSKCIMETVASEKRKHFELHSSLCWCRTPPATTTFLVQRNTMNMARQVFCECLTSKIKTALSSTLVACMNNDWEGNISSQLRCNTLMALSNDLGLPVEQLVEVEFVKYCRSLLVKGQVDFHHNHQHGAVMNLVAFVVPKLQEVESAVANWSFLPSELLWKRVFVRIIVTEIIVPLKDRISLGLSRALETSNARHISDIHLWGKNVLRMSDRQLTVSTQGHSGTIVVKTPHMGASSTSQRTMSTAAYSKTQRTQASKVRLSKERQSNY